MNCVRNAVLATALLVLPVQAQEAAPADEDAAFDDAVRQFGYIGGLAWQCTADAARTGIEGQALEAYQGIVRLFGTDQAFFFAASFGAGTTAVLDASECESHVTSFSEQIAQAKKAD